MKKIATICLQMSLIFILLLSLMGCGKQNNKVIIFSNASYWQFEKEVWITLPMDVMPPIVIPKEVQVMEYTEIEATDLVTVFDLSPVEVCFYFHDTINHHSQSCTVVIGRTYEISVTDAYGNETIAKVQPDVVMNPRREGIPEERINGIGNWITARDIVCVDSTVYAQLKEIYNEIDWYGEFELGDPNVYELYKKKFKELLDNERPYWNPETGNEVYVRDLFHNTEYHSYYFFDFDLDDAPELMLQSPWNSYAFKYDRKQDQVILWKKDFMGYAHIIGSRKVQWWDSYTGYTILDENLKMECQVGYRADGYRDEETGEDVWIFRIYLPDYAAPEKQIELTDEMKEQCYYSVYENRYFFGVTEEQFEELMGHYLDAASEKAEKEKEKAVFSSYEELFGE